MIGKQRLVFSLFLGCSRLFAFPPRRALAMISYPFVEQPSHFQSRNRHLQSLDCDVLPIVAAAVAEDPGCDATFARDQLGEMKVRLVEQVELSGDGLSRSSVRCVTRSRRRCRSSSNSLSVLNPSSTLTSNGMSPSRCLILASSALVAASCIRM